MNVYHGSYLIFYSSGKKCKVKEIIHNIEIWITAIFVFFCFVALKIAVSVELMAQFFFHISSKCLFEWRPERSWLLTEWCGFGKHEWCGLLALFKLKGCKT